MWIYFDEELFIGGGLIWVIWLVLQTSGGHAIDAGDPEVGAACVEDDVELYLGSSDSQLAVVLAAMEVFDSHRILYSASNNN